MLKTRDVIITRLYCYFRDAERSVDSLLADPGQWAAFVAYFEVKLGPFRLLLETIAKPYARTYNLRGQPFAGEIPDTGRTRLIFNRIVYTVAGKRNFSLQEVVFMEGAYEKLVNYIESGSFEPVRTVSVRMAMFDSQLIIRRNTLGDRLLNQCA
jgi:hypothetical protein